MNKITNTQLAQNQLRTKLETVLNKVFGLSSKRKIRFYS